MKQVAVALAKSAHILTFWVVRRVRSSRSMRRTQITCVREKNLKEHQLHSFRAFLARIYVFIQPERADIRRLSLDDLSYLCYCKDHQDGVVFRVRPPNIESIIFDISSYHVHYLTHSKYLPCKYVPFLFPQDADRQVVHGCFRQTLEPCRDRPPLNSSSKSATQWARASGRGATAGRCQVGNPYKAPADALRPGGLTRVEDPSLENTRCEDCITAHVSITRYTQER